ncbi:unnamed protein product [Cylicostephanus goldi]|uniref:Uncharacterized protein n=1 Tax=Cylicostephanus goldi TaxID=71465 RepID=A0A3P7N3X5_CYLGO|nr:unnamed protein product [Cylicostephanus goldi]
MRECTLLQPIQFIPDIQTTAAYLSCREVTAVIPDMTYMAHQLRHSEEMGFPEDEMMEEPITPALRFTETLQVSYDPNMVSLM